MRPLRRDQDESFRRRTGAVRCALLLLALLPFAGQVARASEARLVPARTAAEEEQSLRALLEAGLRAYARGDLAGADVVWAQIRDVHPGHPAAPIWELKTLQSRRTLDYWGGQYEAAIRERAVEAERLSRGWVERVPDDPQAHFYLGFALLELMVIDGMGGQYYQAGTQGEEARVLLERALVLDPEFVDVKLPLGTYYYYGSIATRYVPFLRWLWFVPQGDRETGLRYLGEVARDGDLQRFDGALQLGAMYMYVEDRPDLAKPVLLELAERHPENSGVRFEVVEMRLEQQDYPETVVAALALEQTHGDQFGDATRRLMARVWRTRAEILRGRPAEADALLRTLEARAGELTEWIQRWLLVLRGQLHDLAGERELAIASYSQVSQEKAPFGSRRTADLARDGLEAPFALGPADTAPL